MKKMKRLLVLPADLLCGGHAVHVLHFDVHEDDVELGAVILHDDIAVAVKPDVELLGKLRFILTKVFFQLPGIVGVVFHDGDADHDLGTSRWAPCANCL